MISFHPPTLTKRSVIRLGEGHFQADFDDYMLDITSSEIYDGPNAKVRTDEQYREAVQDYARALPSITRTARISTSDGVPIIHFIKRAMTAPWGDLGESLAELSTEAIKDLIEEYPPPTNLKNNARYSGNLEEEVLNSRRISRDFGVYHWALWRANGQREPVISSDARPKSTNKAAALKTFLHKTKWESIIMYKWFKTLDPTMFQRYWTCNQQWRAEDGLGILDEGDWGCQLGRVLQVNAVAQPHKDPKDATRGLTWTNPWGTFTGGECVYPSLGLKFEQRVGDSLSSPAGALEHMILSHTGGDRYCSVRFTKGDIMDPPIPRYFCDVTGCGLGFKRRSSLKKHQTMKNDATHQTAREQGDSTAAPTLHDTMEHNLDQDMEIDDVDSGSQASETYHFGVESEEPLDKSKRQSIATVAPVFQRNSTQHSVTSSGVRTTNITPTHVDRRPKYHCDVAGCSKSQASGYKGYSYESTMRKHRREAHPA